MCLGNSHSPPPNLSSSTPHPSEPRATTTRRRCHQFCTSTQTPIRPSEINRIPSSSSHISPDPPPMPYHSRSSCSRSTRSCSRVRWRSSARGVPRWVAPHVSVPNLRASFRGVRSASCVRARKGGGGRQNRRSRTRPPSRRRRTDLGAACLAGRGLILHMHHGKHAGRFQVWMLLVGSRHARSASSGSQKTAMTCLSVLRGTQEYKEPSSCLSPFGDPGRRGRSRGRAGGLHVVENEVKCCRSASRIKGSKKGAGRGVTISVLVDCARRSRREELDDPLDEEAIDPCESAE